jgi:hypothetical protein
MREADRRTPVKKALETAKIKGFQPVVNARDMVEFRG